MNNSQRRPTGVKLVALVLGGTVGGVAVLVLLVAGLVAIVGAAGSDDRAAADAQRYEQQAAAICSSLDARPLDRYDIAKSVIPPPPPDPNRAPGVGTAESYRQAADIIDVRCPRHYQQAELLRGMGRIYSSPPGGSGN